MVPARTDLGRFREEVGTAVKPDKPEAPAPGDLTASPGCAAARGTGPS